MPKPTPDEVREHIETDVLDEPLQRLIDAEWTAVVKTFGPETVPVDDLRGGSERAWLSRQASSITSVVETDSSGTETTLESDDYQLENDGRSLRRLTTGTNPADLWQSRIRVTYASNDDYFMTVVELVRLRLQYKALSSERIGDHSEGAVDFQAEREKIMRGVANTRAVLA